MIAEIYLSERVRDLMCDICLIQGNLVQLIINSLWSPIWVYEGELKYIRTKPQAGENLWFRHSSRVTISSALAAILRGYAPT